MFDVFIMDLGGNDDNVQTLITRFPHARVVRYYDNHLDTLKRCISRCRTPYAWVISSVCDYADFDFDYRAKPWEAYQLHCWASGTEKFGDTFLVNVAEFNRQKDIELLEWYKDVNWHAPGVPRLPWPTVVYTEDSLISAIEKTQFNTPYVRFTPPYTANEGIDYDVNLWRQKTRNIVSFSSGNAVNLVPKDTKTVVNTQVYDYPYIKKEARLKDQLQDIIFISYDEPNADENYAVLKDKFPRARRLHGVEGMEKALLKAAEMSETPWYYAVFAKTVIHPDFDFSFSPDYYQEPKHYIFHALNPINELEYGHMGIILYNCNLIKSVTEFGIDYTMSAPHAVVPVLGAIGKFNSNPYQTWRTAFREASKLAQFCDEVDNVENQYRLDVWLSRAEGLYADWCLRGARDGFEFYQANKNDATELKNAFNWAWLKEYFVSIYKDINNPDEVVMQQRQQLWQQR